MPKLGEAPRLRPPQVIEVSRPKSISSQMRFEEQREGFPKTAKFRALRSHGPKAVEPEPVIPPALSLSVSSSILHQEHSGLKK
jgi:hypothetical protein